MEKKEVNPQLEALKQQVAEFAKKNQNKKGSKKSSGENRLAKYFEPRNFNEEFRMTPPLPGKRHIQEAYFHTVTMNFSGGQKRHNKKVYCPAHNNPKIPKLDENKNPILTQEGKEVMIHVPCPLCAKAKRIINTQDQSIKGIKKENMTQDQLSILKKNNEIFGDANKWKAKKFYILRGIDMGKQKDGIKFWRFKDHFRNQGTFDKLHPAITSFMGTYNQDFADPENGGTLSITMADSDFNGISYKAVSAINIKPPSKLHDDPIIVRKWLDDPITWREVFTPKAAPNITPHQYMEMLMEGNDPYWDESDPQKKKWVFPGRPDLEEMANNRSRNLDADGNEEENIEQASDLVNDGITIDTVTSKDTGTFQDNAVDVGASVNKEIASQESASSLIETEGNKTVTPTTPVEETKPTQAIPDANNLVESADNNEVDPYDDLPF